MSYIEAYLSLDSSNENSDGTETNESDEMSEEMEVFSQVEPCGLLCVSYVGYYFTAGSAIGRKRIP